MNIVDTLKSFPLLSKIKDEEIKEFSLLLKEESFPAGSNIITEGDNGTTMYILSSGVVDIIKTTIYGDEFICATLKSEMHCVFGEMALIDADKRSATVKAKTDCIAFSIKTEDFQSFCRKCPSAGVELLTFISINLVRNIRKENENLKLVYQALIEEIESN